LVLLSEGKLAVAESEEFVEVTGGVRRPVELPTDDAQAGFLLLVQETASKF
jgi:hypothetical protein